MPAPTPRTPNYKLFLTEPDRRGWQDQYYENMLIIDSGLSAVSNIVGFRGVWANNTDYVTGDRVTDSDTALIYECAVDHLSALAPTTFAEERLANPSYWASWSVPARSRGAWAPDTLYVIGDFVAHGHIYAVCIDPHVSTAVFADDAAFWSYLIDATATVEACETAADEAEASAIAAEASALSVGQRLIGTSATSMTIGLGAQVLTTQPAEGWCPGIYITVSRTASPAQYMSGVVTAYDVGTGILNFIADAISGGGTDNSWNIALGGRGGTGGGGMAISNTATHTQVPAAPSSVVILAANANRVGATVYNDSTSPMQIKLGTPVTLADFTLQLTGGSYFEAPFGWTGVISGMWTTAVGAAHVVELTP